jgi:hypothetical protein
MDFSEGPNMKAPRGFRVPLWSLFYHILGKKLVSQKQ